MAKRKPDYQIPAKGVVRFCGVVLLLVSAGVLFVGVTNYRALGWWAWIIGGAGLMSIFFAGKAIQTGKPEWIMLDFIMSF